MTRNRLEVVMQYQGPREERAFLSAYERHQLRMIEQNLANEDFGSPGIPAYGTGDVEPNPIWIALMIGGGWLTLIGTAATSSLFLLLGVAITTTALVMYHRARRKRPGAVN